MDFATYQSIDALNASLLKIGAAKSILHMRYAASHPTEPTDAMQFGTLVHAAILEPSSFAAGLAIWTGGRRAGKEWEQFNDDNAGKMIVRPDELNSLMQLSAAVHAKPLAHRLIAESEHEVVIQWESPAYGKAKARLDGLLKDGTFFDFKTTGKITEFAKQVSNGYDLQMGWYREGLDTIKPIKRRKGYFIVCETSAPYDVAVYQIPPNVLQVGFEKALRVAADYRQCERTGVFTGVQPVEGGKLEMPTWYASADDVDLDDIMPMDPSEL